MNNMFYDKVVDNQILNNSPIIFLNKTFRINVKLLLKRERDYVVNYGDGTTTSFYETDIYFLN